MSKESKPQGKLELLQAKHFTQENPWGHDVVGWLPTSQGIGLQNPRGFAMLRVVTNKMQDDEMVALYDQPIIVENAGSIIIAQIDDKVGLTQNFRFVGDRLLPDAGSNYIKKLQEKKLWKELTSSLGT